MVNAVIYSSNSITSGRDLINNPKVATIRSSNACIRRPGLRLKRNQVLAWIILQSVFFIANFVKERTWPDEIQFVS